MVSNYKEFLKKKEDELKLKPTIIKKKEISEQTIIKKVVVTKNISSYSKDELLEELDKRNIKEREILLKEDRLRKNNPTLCASEILDGMDDFKANKGNRRSSNPKAKLQEAAVDTALDILD